MTIRTIGLSAVAIAVLGVSAYAGTVTNSSQKAITPIKVATQLAADENVTMSQIQANNQNLTITSGVTAPITQPNLTIRRTDGKAFDTNATAELTTLVLENDKNATIAGQAQLSNDKKSIVLTGVAKETINPGNYYYLRSDANTSQGIPLTLYKGESGVGLTFTFSNQNGTTVDTATSGNLIEQGLSGFSYSILKFSQKIDASSGFKKFTNFNSTLNTNAYDEAKIMVTSAPATNNFINGSLVRLYVQGSQTANLIGFTDSITDQAGKPAKDSNTSGFADFNASVPATGTSAIVDIKLKPDGKHIIPTTTFTANKIIAEFKGQNGKDYNTTLATNASLGSWAIYGYSAVVPNVTYSSAANIQTVFTFTNQSSVSANVYFIVYNNNGGEPTTVNMGVLPAGYTKKYNFSDILAKGNLPQGSYTVKVSIPTTPSKVYGFASFRNSTLGAFKTLPMYSNWIGF